MHHISISGRNGAEGVNFFINFSQKFPFLCDFGTLKAFQTEPKKSAWRPIFLYRLTNECLQSDRRILGPPTPRSERP